MNDTKEIVLYFENGTTYDALDVAKELKTRYKELGSPIILPESKDSSKPMIVFNENPDFVIQTNFISISCVVKRNYFKDLDKIVFDIVDTFSDMKIDIVRMGYLANVFLSPVKIEKFKNKFLNCRELDGVIDYHVSWYKELDLEIGKLNCWERFITNHLDFKDLLCQYDINTKADDKININMKFIKKFLTVANDYVDERTNF